MLIHHFDEEKAHSWFRSAKRVGSNFFVLDQELWKTLWYVPTINRLNLVTAFLVLLAGTGPDHRLTKWSARACETYAGMGKPRAQKAIAELIAGGLAEYAEGSTNAFPHYRLAKPVNANTPTFLPVQLVTGLAGETPVLRRVRETGDPLTLRMLVELYAYLPNDATCGVPIENLCKGKPDKESSRQIFDAPPNSLWALHLDDTLWSGGGGDWRYHQGIEKGNNKWDWTPLWPRLDALRKIGALWFEPWVFDGWGVDAEPLFPVAIERGQQTERERLEKLDRLRSEAAYRLLDKQSYLLEREDYEVLAILPSHHQPPALRGVARMRVEADTPGRRTAYAKRMELIERQEAAYRQLLAAERVCDTPIRVG